MLEEETYEGSLDKGVDFAIAVYDDDDDKGIWFANSGLLAKFALERKEEAEGNEGSNISIAKSSSSLSLDSIWNLGFLLRLARRSVFDKTDFFCSRIEDDWFFGDLEVLLVLLEYRLAVC